MTSAKLMLMMFGLRPGAPALVVVLVCLGAAGCQIAAVATPTCVTDDDCGSGNACSAGACVAKGAAQGGGTWAIELVPPSGSSAATTRLPAVTFSDDVTVLSTDGKQTVAGMLAPGASLAGASHMVASLQTAIPGYTDLQIETDSSLVAGMSDAWFTFGVPTGALGRAATFRLIPLPPRDVAQPPVTVTAPLTPTVNLSYSSNYYFISGRLISPSQQVLPNYVARAFAGTQLVSSVVVTDSLGRFRIATPVEAAYTTTGQSYTVEIASAAGGDAAALRFTTPPIMLTNHLELNDLTIPAVPASASFRLKIATPSGQPIAGAVVRVHTDVSVDRSGGLDFTRDGVTDATGIVDMMLLTGTSASPRSYDIAVAAPPSSRFGSTCMTGFRITDQTPTGAAIVSTLSVPEKATLPGTILSFSGEVVPGVAIAATPTGLSPTDSCGKASLPATAASTTSGRDGSFQLMLTPGTYLLDYDPPSGAPVPRLTETGVTVTAGKNGSRGVQLPRGALLKGMVRDAAGAPLPLVGVRFLEVACVGQDACFGRNRVTPIVRGITNSDGDAMFRVVVPLPAQ